MMIDRHKFFEGIRLLFSSFTQWQVDGINSILNEWEKDESNTDKRQLAYIFATVFHETGKTMQPIKEWGGEAYLRKKPYYPFFGRGLVQITWKENYEKFGKLLNIDLVDNPDLALEMGNALFITFEGMKEGLFTGKKLSDYFNEEKEDAINARRIINGLDKTQVITAYYTVFKKALT